MYLLWSLGVIAMIKFLPAAACLIAGLLLCGCSETGQAHQTDTVNDVLSVRLSDGTEFKDSDILEFYYTYDRSGYNAEYQRYRFYSENGKHMFDHDHRQIRNDYGFAYEARPDRKGTFALKDDEWEEFCGFLQDGEISQRNDEPLDGDSGPWMYLYLDGYDSEGLVFAFASADTQLSFEEFCDSLADARWRR